MTREPLPETIELTLGLDEADDDTALKRAVAKKLGVSAGDVPLARIARRVSHARKGHVRFHLQVSTTPPPDPETLGEPLPQQTDGKARVVIVGDGPCGLFAAWELARRGICSIVVDRGKTVNPRRLDLRTLNRPYLGTVNEDSNYCFGEGGAGSGCRALVAPVVTRHQGHRARRRRHRAHGRFVARVRYRHLDGGQGAGAADEGHCHRSHCNVGVSDAGCAAGVVGARLFTVRDPDGGVAVVDDHPRRLFGSAKTELRGESAQRPSPYRDGLCLLLLLLRGCDFLYAGEPDLKPPHPWSRPWP